MFSRAHFSSLRGRLFLLVLAAVIPALLLIFYTAAEQRRVAEAGVQSDALRLARLVAGSQEQLTDEARQLLITLAHIPDVRGGDAEACSRLLAELLVQYPQYTNLGVVSANGSVTCSATPYRSAVSMSGLPYFERALQSQGLVGGGYQVDPITGKPAILFAYPLPDAAGRVQSVIFAALDLGWVNRLMADMQLPEGGVITAIDQEGTILIDSPGNGQRIGQRLPDSPLVQAILIRGEGTADVSGLDGVSRLYAFVPLRSTPDIGISVGVGVSKEAAFVDANRLLMRQIIGLGVVFLFALAAAWWGGEFFILRRVRDLLDATRRLETGDLSARTGLPYGQGELSQLARSFDRMSAALRQREEERRAAEKTVERHNRDLAALNQVISAVSASLDLPQILDDFKRQMVDQMGVPGGVIFICDTEAESLTLEAAWGVPPAVLAQIKHIPTYSFHYPQVVQAREAISQPDFRQVEPYDQTELGTIRPGWQGYLSIPLVAKGDVLGVVDLFSQAPAVFSTSQAQLFITLGKQLGVVIQNARLFGQVRAAHERLKMLSQQLLEVQEAERRHISRELHDEIGQALTAVKVNLQTLGRRAGEDLRSPYLDESIAIVERAIQQVRALSVDLRPSLLDDLGVVAALRWYVDRQGQRAGFKTEFVADPPDLRLPPDMETVCFRVVQEALTNVVRHAVASMVRVELRLCDGSLELSIRDNGVGFDVNAVRVRAAGDTSLGLLGMQERVQLIGGQIEISSDPDQGTEIHAVFPLPGE